MSIVAAWMVAAGAQGAEAAAAAKELKYEEPLLLTASIYSLDGDGRTLLYKFKRTATRSGSTLNVERDYTYLDGKPAAREHMVYNGDAIVLYELQELQLGAAGSAQVQAVPRGPGHSKLEFTYGVTNADRRKVRNEDLAESTLNNDMIGPFLAEHWDALARGEKVKCRLIVVPRKETVGFTFTRQNEASWKGRKVLLVKMEPTSPFISALVAPLIFTLGKDPPHHVLQYVGRTTPKVQIKGKWKDLDAVTVFDW